MFKASICCTASGASMEAGYGLRSVSVDLFTASIAVVLEEIAGSVVSCGKIPPCMLFVQTAF